MGARTRAIVVDIIVVSILHGVINSVFGTVRVFGGVVDPAVDGGLSSYVSTTAVDTLWLLLATFAYFTLLEGLFGATVGKAVVGLRVTDLEGRQAGWRPVIVRNLLRPIDAFPFFYLLGGLLVRFSRFHQRLGDRVAGTLVVPARAVVGPSLTEQQRRMRLGLVLGVLGLFAATSAAFFYFGRPPIVLDNAMRLTDLAGGHVASYNHGTARWGDGSVTYPDGSVTYPVMFTLVGSHQACSGTVTLYWGGFPQGWQMGSAESHCP